jgi:hypothetical protein
MRVVLFTCACESYKISELLVDWNWLLESCKIKNEVWVLTGRNHNEFIETYFQENEISDNPFLVYYDFLKKLVEFYSSHGWLIFPSMPVICLNLGGPYMLITDSSGINLVVDLL